MKHKVLTLTVLLVCLCSAVWAQKQASSKGPWKDIQELALPKYPRQVQPIPKKFRLLELDLETLKSALDQTFQSASSGSKTVRSSLDVPMPDGSFQTFNFEYAPVMHPDLAAKFPEIRSYAGVGANNPLDKIYFDFSPLGFHAIILSAGKPISVIEAVNLLEPRYYYCYLQSQSAWDAMEIECASHTGRESHKLHAPTFAEKAGDCQIRTYRVALATTGEYTAAYANPPTDPTGVTGALATLNTLVTTVNGVYLNEIGIQLQLIANNNLLIFTNAVTDGYTNGAGNQNTMAAENQGIVDGIIGGGNYDISRAYGTRPLGGASGVSLQLGNACNNSNKANGATVMNPANAASYATLEMHEVGHQFGANHTFNDGTTGSCGNAGQLNPGTAFEPGSGSTIMSYGGTCGVQNVQGSRDNYFHTISLQEIGNYVSTGTGSTCPTTVTLGNNAPTVAVAGAATYTIPANTPFRLTANANDPDGDALTYCWEQFDNQIIPSPPQATATNGPVFRSVFPGASPSRYFPNLGAILNGTPSVWEVLPSVTRSMNFTVTVRDNAPVGGCTDEATATVNVNANAGPFLLTSIGFDGACLTAEDNTTISWNVANTTAAPVNCANVDIWLSLDGGVSFSVPLALGTPNDGTQLVAIPASAVTTQGRIMVIGSGNIFLSINDSDIRIDCPKTRTVNDNPAVGVYKARETVITSGSVVVQAGTQARFYGGIRVILKPGFWAQRGSDFQARIKPCDPCVAGKPEALVFENENPSVYFYETWASDRTNGIEGATLNAFAFPNPFDQNFTVNFDLPIAGKVEIQLFDLAGRMVQSVYQNDALEAGTHQISVSTNALESGVYNCRIIGNGRQAQIKLVKIN